MYNIRELLNIKRLKNIKNVSVWLAGFRIHKGVKRTTPQKSYPG